MTSFIIPKISRSEYMKRLRKRPFENMKTIQAVESLLINKRGYIFKMPPPGTPIILLVSGGLDSTSLWGLLLEKYGLHVYPLFLYRDNHRSKKEHTAAKFFSIYFHKRYPTLSEKVYTFSTRLSPPEIMRALKNPLRYYHPQRLLDQINTKNGSLANNMPNCHPQRVLPYLHVFYCLVYSQYLLEHFNIRAKTIFTAILVGDGLFVPGQTFTSLQTALLSICSVTAEYDWQYCSLPLERELGYWMEKKDLIIIGHALGIPLEKTWSCYKAGRYQCGNECLTCHSRRLEFRRAHIKDKTQYAFNQPNRRIILLLQRLLDKALHLVYATLKGGRA